MNIKPHRDHRDATEFDVGTFETRIRAKLPDDYRAFLLRHNGGYPERAGFRGGDDSVEFFFGLWQKHADLNYETLARRNFIPAEMVPIASDAFGNCVLLEVRGSNRGRIWFWDHEMSSDPAKSVSLLASSFTEFIGSLVPTDEE